MEIKAPHYVIGDSTQLNDLQYLKHKIDRLDEYVAIIRHKLTEMSDAIESMDARIDRAYDETDQCTLT